MAKPQSSPRVVVVLGMHRSGTSLLGSVLHAIGVGLGADLIAGDTHNARGYFEHAGIVRTHHNLLEHLDRRWTGRKGILPFRSDWWMAKDVQPFKQTLKDMVAREVAQSPGVWGFKDPRVSRLVPLWTTIFKDLGLEPVYLLAVRHPHAVAASLLARDAIPQARAQLLWLQHNLDALRDARGRSLHVVEYDRWFTDLRRQVESVVQAVGLSIPGTMDDLMTRLADAIRPELRHHTPTGGEFLPFVEETYVCLQEAAVRGQLPERLWAIERRVAEAESLLRPWAEALESSVMLQDAQRADSGDGTKFIDRLRQSLKSGAGLWSAR
ncbi:MAG TPA: hypothetical protein VFI11_05090 [Anaerolineales bacterium]|nr:hypothetical protein [Anaerolineales bacterium]